MVYTQEIITGGVFVTVSELDEILFKPHCLFFIVSVTGFCAQSILLILKDQAVSFFCLS